jgi:hypothetical protein
MLYSRSRLDLENIKDGETNFFSRVKSHASTKVKEEN